MNHKEVGTPEVNPKVVSHQRRSVAETPKVNHEIVMPEANIGRQRRVGRTLNQKLNMEE